MTGFDPIIPQDEEDPNRFALPEDRERIPVDAKRVKLPHDPDTEPLIAEVLGGDDKKGMKIENTDDGGAIIQLEEDNKQATEIGDFYDNIVELFDEPFLEALSTRLLEEIEIDKESRKKRDEQYAEAIKRTGLGKEAPGGASFEGASKAVHPMIAQSSVDFEARAIKELMPPNGPVRMFVPGDNPSADRMKKAERKKAYMNWQFVKQMPEFRSELEKLLTQLPLAGEQYLRLTPDYAKRRRRPVPRCVPIDEVSIPFAAANFYSAERQTYHEPMTRYEFKKRVEEGMYRDIGPDTSSQMPEPTKPQAATEKIEGKEDSGYNKDGLKIVHECSCFESFEQDAEGQKGSAPYLISIDGPSHKIVSIVRNWEQEDEDFERMQWMVSFGMIPWRGAYHIGLGQLIGSLAGAATGALRALLDAALIQNSQVLAKLKGTNFTGQQAAIDPTQVLEIEGGVTGTKDIRELLMHIPFPGPSETLFKLLGFLTDAGQNAIHIAMEKLSEGSADMPVGTTLALIEEGMRVQAAIHLRLYHSMEYVINVLHRIDRMYVTEEEMLNDIGEVLAYREDFEGPLDCIPVADPEVFSDVQRIAQAQIVADRAATMPQLYDQREAELMLLERAKIPNRDRLLIPVPKPQRMNQVNENVAMTLGRPVAAFPDQDQLAHIQVLVDFMESPIFGQNIIIAPTFMGAALGHLKEHLVYWYANEFYELVMQAADADEEQMKTIMSEQDVGARRELDQTLEAASSRIMKRADEVWKQLPPIIQKAQQLLSQLAPPNMGMPSDPNKMAAVQAKREGDQLRAQTEDKKIQSRTQEKVIDLQARREERQALTEVDFAKLSAVERQAAIKAAQDDARQTAEIAARLQELAQRERGEDERAAAELDSLERRNIGDNVTAVRIAAAEIESDDKVDRSTGTGTNPNPSGSRSR